MRGTVSNYIKVSKSKVTRI